MSEYIVYTDGSCLGNPGPGGWAAIVMNNSHIEESWGFMSNTTNNQMELRAAIEGLKKAFRDNDQAQVVLISDSQYLRMGITQWIYQWQKNGWKTASKKSVKNQDLWQELHELTTHRKIEWQWVKGHGGNKWNERADTLARQAAVEQRGSES